MCSTIMLLNLTRIQCIHQIFSLLTADVITYHPTSFYIFYHHHHHHYYNIHLIYQHIFTISVVESLSKMILEKCTTRVTIKILNLVSIHDECTVLEVVIL